MKYKLEQYPLDEELPATIVHDDGKVAVFSAKANLEWFNGCKRVPVLSLYEETDKYNVVSHF